MDSAKYFPISEPVVQSSNILTYVIVICIIIIIIAIVVKFIYMYDLLARFNNKIEPTFNSITKPEEYSYHKQEEHKQEEQQQEKQKQEEQKQEEMNKPVTKQQYNKGDEIILPSSISHPVGYIGRDQVCFRGKLGNIAYMKQRPGCMACLVDNRSEKERKTYDGTNTNVIASCTYSDEASPNDPTIWTKQKCIIECAKIPDLK